MAIRFTVITPVYNGEKYIEKCIKAVASSQYDLNSIEHIVVDDGSTDSTKTICESLCKTYPHLRFYSKTNGNWGSVINYVKNNKLAHGEYIVICDADDVILPNAFNLVDKYGKNTEFVIGDFYWYNGERKTLRVPSYCYLFKTLFTKKNQSDYFNIGFYPHCTYLKNEIFYKINDLQEKCFFQDSVLFSQAFYMAKSIKHIRKAVSMYWHRRPDNSCTRVDDLSVQSSISRLREFEKLDMIMPFIFFMYGERKIVKQYLKDKQIQFTFKNKKIKFNGYPFYFRPTFWLMYLIIVKKFIKK